MPKPTTRLKTQAKAKVGLRDGDRRTIGFSEKNDRSINSRKATNEIQADVLMTGSPNQSCRGPSSRTYSSAPSATAIAIRCDQSMRPNIVGLAVSILTKTIV